MASIVESFKELSADRFVWFKIVVLSIPVYYSYQVYLQSKHDFTYFYWVVGITLFFLFGIIIKIANNVINTNNCILPSLNPLKLAFSAVKGLLAVGPTVIAFYLLANYLCSMIHIIPWLDITLKSLIWMVVSSFVLTSFLMFSARENILDAFHLKAFFEKAADLIVIILFFLLKLAFINLLINGFIAYVIFILFGFGPFFDYFVVIVVVLNICIIGHYMGQVHFENLSDYKK